MDTVRKMSEQDIPQAAQVIGRAFCDNPVMVAIIERDAEKRAQSLGQFHQRALSVFLRAGACWVLTEDEQVRSVMLTLPPGSYPLAWHRDLKLVWSSFVIGGFRPTRRFTQVDDFVRQRHPRHEHTYLYLLGTEPVVQGCGYASRLLSRLAEETAGGEVYLETDHPKNLPFYERHGYHIVGQEQCLLQPEGFPLWFMSNRPERYR
jgi:ribosomal protein S18 acetylase RimI-like enzyme